MIGATIKVPLSKLSTVLLATWTLASLAWSLPHGSAALDERCSDPSYLVGSASHLVVGRVRDIEGRWGDDGFIYTLVTLEVASVLRGDLEDDEIVVRRLGGAFQSVSMIVEDEPTFTLNERVRLHLIMGEEGQFVVVCGDLGKETLELNPSPVPSPYDAIRQSMDLILGLGVIALAGGIFYGLHGRSPKRSDDTEETPLSRGGSFSVRNLDAHLTND
ncbi:MAG: hypothetical protein ACE5IB_04905 [Candidatus Geothermarchaeales archaeon]